MTNTPRVLVVDGISETETVLKAVFEPQGTRVERRRSSDAADHNRTPPRVMVVDLDDQSAYAAKSDWPDVPRVILGSQPLDAEHGRARFLEKPFHYPELIRLVQSLLDQPTERRRVG